MWFDVTTVIRRIVLRMEGEMRLIQQLISGVQEGTPINFLNLKQLEVFVIMKVEMYVCLNIL